MPSIIQSTRCKSTISSLLLSTFTNNHENTKITPKKHFKNPGLRGFGCAARPEVTVPAVIRSSADWESNQTNNRQHKNKHNNVAGSSSSSRKKKNKNKNKNAQQLQSVLMDDPIGSVGVQDLWCGDASAAASVDCVRPLSSGHNNRGKIDLDKLHHREVLFILFYFIFNF